MDKIIAKKLMVQKFGGIEVLPIFPDSIAGVKDLYRKKSNELGRLVKIIEKDPCLAVQFLKKAGLKEPLSIENAVRSAGLFEVKALAMDLPVLRELGKPEHHFREHSYSSFLLMKALLSENQLQVGADLPLAMLFHDLGNMVLREYAPHLYSISEENATTQQVEVCEVQTNLIHLHHGEISEIILSKWGFPESITKPVRFHHLACVERKDLPQDHLLEIALVQLVNFVDNTCRRILALKPSDLLLQAAGIAEIDYNYWGERQRKLISNLKREEEFQVEDFMDENSDTVPIRRVEPKKALFNPRLQQNRARGEVVRDWFLKKS